MLVLTAGPEECSAVKAVPWRKLSSTEVFSHPRIRLVEDSVELPDGKIATYMRYAPAQAHSVAVIAVNDQQEMLLQKEYSYPPDQVMWQLPGGRIEQGEGVLTAANRELSEESGVVGESCEQIGFFYTNNRRSDARQFVVVCKNLRHKAARRDDMEFIETHWIPISELRAMTAAGEFVNVNLLAALNMFFAKDR